MKKILVLLQIITLCAGAVFAGGQADASVKTQKKIRVLSMTAQISDGIEKYIDQFEKETGIKVELELYGDQELRQKEMTEFMTGTSTVDAYMFSPLQDMTPFSKNGWVEPLDAYLKDADFDWADFKAPQQQITIKGTGKVGCLPLYSSVQLMYYRKDIFAKNGIVPPKTYDELINVCEKINDPSNNFYAVACRGEKIALTSQFSPFLFGFGASFFKNGTSAFRSPEALEAVKFYGRLLGQYAPPGIMNAGYSQMTQLFNSGTVGIVIDAAALYSSLIDKNESKFADQVGVAPIPAGPAGAHSYKQVVWAIAMYSGSKNKDAAWKFMKFVAGKDVATYITPRGMPSFRNSVWTDPRVTGAMVADITDAYAKTNAITTNNEYGLPRMTSVTEARDAMGQAVVYSIETKGNGGDLNKKMQEAADKVDALLKKANEYGSAYNW
ncbi:sugar ABC transporter substrate-binding protein [Treponema parvum]|uniref:Sugar ABC transporter substrate-binding protein n=1 Tax=Treponema parvum TaxID=138851 RepID=A0A975F505_9SPIR|nr:sugar ABC transporter substrate-binding protein [Treponema parvum]QTQ14542.1 sugar ABC transporter substrate-binding protein [Treponema parvum]